jgi:hypothetical protein
MEQLARENEEFVSENTRYTTRLRLTLMKKKNARGAAEMQISSLNI